MSEDTQSPCTRIDHKELKAEVARLRRENARYSNETHDALVRIAKLEEGLRRIADWPEISNPAIRDIARSPPGGQVISPDVIKEEMGRVRRACTELDHLARVVATTYEEAHDAAFRKQGTAGYETPIGRGNFSGADPTGEVATSGMHRRMRSRLRQAARTVRRMRPILEDAEDTLLEAFMETDPEFREKLRRLRELEAAAEGK